MERLTRHFSRISLAIHSFLAPDLRLFTLVRRGAGWAAGGARTRPATESGGRTMYPNTNPAAVVGVFDDYRQAEQAIQELRRSGFRDDEIGILSRTTHMSETGIVNDPTHSRWEEGAGIGAAAGAITGTGLGLAVAAGLIPGVGPVIVGGALAALLASAGAGAAVGTVLGALIGLGIPEEESQFYESEFKAGRTLVTVRAGSRNEDARPILTRFGAHEPATSGAAFGSGVEATPY